MKNKIYWPKTNIPFPVLWAIILICFVFGGIIRAEDLADAVAAGKVNVKFLGTGGSSGDAVTVVVTKAKKGGEDLELSIPAGTRLASGNASAQSMVIAGVRGRRVSEDSYAPTEAITVDDSPHTYVLDAYCADFEKENPSATTKFALQRVDPILACIFSKSGKLSTPAKQAAVWIYTDRVTFSHVNEKFSVSRSEWNAALTVVKECLGKEDAPPKK